MELTQEHFDQALKAAVAPLATKEDVHRELRRNRAVSLLILIGLIIVIVLSDITWTLHPWAAPTEYPPTFNPSGSSISPGTPDYTGVNSGGLNMPIIVKPK
jgi:uncharacterized membrane protein